MYFLPIVFTLYDKLCLFNPNIHSRPADTIQRKLPEAHSMKILFYDTKPYDREALESISETTFENAASFGRGEPIQANIVKYN